MDLGQWMKIWMWAGVLLIASELILPGFVSMFLGLACLTVALALAAGWIEQPLAMLITFVTASVIYTLTIRQWFESLFGGKKVHEEIDEDIAAVGTVVTVLSTIEGLERCGKIEFRGAAWDAQSCSGTIVKGEQARLLRRDNLLWTVERLEPSEGDIER